MDPASYLHEAVQKPLYNFVTSPESWTPVKASSPSRQVSEVGINLDPKLTIISWNIHTHQVSPVKRIQALICHVLGLNNVDVIFLQEVSKPTLLHLLEDPQIRGSWFSTEQDTTRYGGHRFITMLLLSKQRFASASLGPQWRVKYPSCFGRNALCCDISIPSFSSDEKTLLRLINVRRFTTSDFSAFKAARPTKQLPVFCEKLDVD